MEVIYRPGGDLFEAVDKPQAILAPIAIVNATNTVGVMGGGLAKVFADRYPEMEADYKAACQDGRHTTRRVHVYPMNGFYIINFATKADWRNDSKLEYIEDGMFSLIEIVDRLAIAEVHIPMLGCGLGKLEWPDVRSQILSAIEWQSDMTDPEIWTKTIWYLYGEAADVSGS